MTPQTACCQRRRASVSCIVRRVGHKATEVQYLCKPGFGCKAKKKPRKRDQ